MRKTVATTRWYDRGFNAVGAPTQIDSGQLPVGLRRAIEDRRDETYM